MAIETIAPEAGMELSVKALVAAYITPEDTIQKVQAAGCDVGQVDGMQGVARCVDELAAAIEGRGGGDVVAVVVEEVGDKAQEGVAQAEAPHVGRVHRDGELPLAVATERQL